MDQFEKPKTKQIIFIPSGTFDVGGAEPISKPDTHLEIVGFREGEPQFFILAEENGSREIFIISFSDESGAKNFKKILESSTSHIMTFDRSSASALTLGFLKDIFREAGETRGNIVEIREIYKHLVADLNSEDALLSMVQAKAITYSQATPNSDVFELEATHKVVLTGLLAEAYPGERRVEGVSSFMGMVTLKTKDLAIQIDFKDEKALELALVELSNAKPQTYFIDTNPLVGNPHDNAIHVSSVFVTKNTDAGVETLDKTIYPKVNIPGRLDVGLYDHKVDYEYNSLMLSLAPFFDIVVTFKDPGGAEKARKNIAKFKNPIITFDPALHDEVIKFHNEIKDRKEGPRPMEFGIVSGDQVHVSENRSSICLEMLDEVSRASTSKNLKRMDWDHYFDWRFEQKYGHSPKDLFGGPSKP
jgi:hypothetical protein